MARRMDDNLFQSEQDVLEKAMMTIAETGCCDSELKGRYKWLIDEYKQLLKITRKVFYISDSQGRLLQRQQGEIQNLLDNANQGFLTFGRDLKVNRQYSAECVRIFEKKIGGMSIIELLGQGNHDIELRLREALSKIFTCGSGANSEVPEELPKDFRVGDKVIRVTYKRIPQNDDRDMILIMMILSDITEKLKAEEQIHFLSYHDKLTSLYNRAYAESALTELSSPESLPLSIIMADMNGLKLVNDVFGHQHGDKLLIAMAKALERSCRRPNIIARWGGDEFVIVLPRTNEAACQEVFQRITASCDEVVDCVIPLSAAIGSVTINKCSQHLTEVMSVAENRMYNDKLIKSREVRANIVDYLETTLGKCCFDHHGHCDRIRQLAVDFAKYIGIESGQYEIKILNRLAGLHDIGKVSIPSEVLRGTGPLSESEWDVVKGHSGVGYRMAQSIGESAVADIVLALHERWDGTGYPFGLEGEGIPYLARLFAIVDAYDVMTHERSYRPKMDKQAALIEIGRCAGTQFDPSLAKRFIDFAIRI